MTTFKEIEHAAWVSRADIYDDFAGALTGQAISPILDAVGDLTGKRLLDVACGTGHLAGAAAALGADVEGIDFAATMVAKARDNYPALKFSEGDGEALAHEDASFDAVACAFGLLHMESPESAMSEVFRILKHGGRFVFTLWYGPDQGGEFFALVKRAVESHGALDVALPPAPDSFSLTDLKTCSNTMRASGFAEPKIVRVPLVWRGDKPEAIIDFIYKITVRTSMLIQAQTGASRNAIHRAVIDGAERHRKANVIELAWPAALVTAVKP